MPIQFNEVRFGGNPMEDRTCFTERVYKVQKNAKYYYENPVDSKEHFKCQMTPFGFEFTYFCEKKEEAVAIIKKLQAILHMKTRKEIELMHSKYRGINPTYNKRNKTDLDKLLEVVIKKSKTNCNGFQKNYDTLF